MNWIYQGSEVQDSDVPEKAIGFIYIIQHESGRKYIGKKLLDKAGTKMVNGKKKKIRKPNDWQNYWSSSPWLSELIETEGKEKFTRKILMFCMTRGELNYAEEKLQYCWNVLESDRWYNSNIRSRIFGKHVEKYNIKEINRIRMIYGDVVLETDAKFEC